MVLSRVAILDFRAKLQSRLYTCDFIYEIRARWETDTEKNVIYFVTNPHK